MKKIKFAILPTLAVASLSVFAAQTVSSTNSWPSSYGTAASQATSSLYSKAPGVTNVSLNCYTFPAQSSFAGRWICTATGTVL